MLHSFLWLNNTPLYIMFWGFPGDTSGKEPTCQCRRHKRLRSNPWVKKITWRRKWQPTPVLLPGKFPWTEKPGRLQSIGLQRVRHDWNNLACTYFCFAYSFCILFIHLSMDTCILFIHSSVDTCVASTFWLLWTFTFKYNIHICLSPIFQFFEVYTQH